LVLKFALDNAFVSLSGTACAGKFEDEGVVETSLLAGVL
jgi:hypothetical protein